MPWHSSQTTLTGGRKLHLDFAVAQAPAGGAHAAAMVVAEMLGLQPFGFGEGQHGEEFAQAGKDIDIGADVGADGVADRVLVDGEHLVEWLDARNVCVPLSCDDIVAQSRPCWMAGSRTWCSSVDLPDPETPVRQVMTPMGMSTSIFFRLWSGGFANLDPAFVAGRRCAGRGIG